MTNVVWLCGYLFLLHAVHSYILLTANLEDFNVIAKQIAASPVAGQINQIIRRASNMFNKHVEIPQIKKRANSNDASEVDVEDGSSDRLQYVTLSSNEKDYSKQQAINELETNEVTAEDEIKIGKINKKEHKNKKVDNDGNKYGINDKKKDGQKGKENDGMERRNLSENNIVKLANGKNASFYLSSIRKIFDDV